LSANKITQSITVFEKNGYNFYSVQTENGKYIIGGCPKGLEDVFIEEASLAKGLILLTSKPEFSYVPEKVFQIREDLKIFASSAGLRNLKEIFNHSFNEELVKDNMNTDGITFLVMPNLHWVDTVMIYFDGVLFSGEMFSGYDGSAVGLKKWFKERLSVNKQFVISAVERLEKITLSAICPSYGKVCPQGTECKEALPYEVLNKYRQWADKKKSERKTAVIIYSSEYGFTQMLAQFAYDRLKDEFDASLIDVKETDLTKAAEAVNEADMLLVGTNTINRNAPKEIWQCITNIDLVNNRQKPYFVFGSFGWAGDGIKLIDKTLYNMGMKNVSKPVEVLFKPSDDDFEKMEKAIVKLVGYIAG
jgi:flavorubredoxin